MKMKFSAVAAGILSTRFSALATAQAAQVEAIEKRIEDARAVVTRLEEQRDTEQRRASELDFMAETDFGSESTVDETEHGNYLDQIDAALVTAEQGAYGNPTLRDEIHEELIAFRKARLGIVDGDEQ